MARLAGGKATGCLHAAEDDDDAEASRCHLPTRTTLAMMKVEKALKLESKASLTPVMSLCCWAVSPGGQFRFESIGGEGERKK